MTMDGGNPGNPYLPPKADLEVVAPGMAALAPPANLASLMQRLGGSMFDGLLGIITMAPALIGIFSDQSLVTSRAAQRSAFWLWTGTGAWGAVSGVLLLVLWGLQWMLITTRGQTVGKMVAGTRIERLDGSDPGFVHGVLLRLLPGTLLGFMGRLAGFVNLADALFVFKADRRCLHDLIAGTRVVQATARR